jgi:hypothetical protein
MTEAEWLAATDPEPMLAALRAAGKASERKVRLWAAACVRRVWPLLTDPRSRQAVEVVEQYADGRDLSAALRVAHRDAPEASASDRHGPSGTWHFAAYAVRRLARTSSPEGRFADSLAAARSAAAARACGAIKGLPWGENAWRRSVWEGAAGPETEAHAALARDLFGPCLFRQVRIEASWLLWNSGTVGRLAAASYEERALSEGTLDAWRLGVLADALEESGCQEQEVLGHLRQQGGVHVRGCWVVDLLLGKG